VAALGAKFAFYNFIVSVQYCLKAIALHQERNLAIVNAAAAVVRHLGGQACFPG